MNFSGIMSITRKEIRSYFLSPVAVIFLGVFLLITLFTFFTQSRFFIRGIADVRPLFEWMPLLLVFLVSAITMRQWSEEQKMGTLEVLLTLPLKTSELVLGKFFAGFTLVSVALALTLPLPLTIAQLGPLDSGPVIGGYVAALLLASAYLAVGLCVSALSDNQIVSLMVTLIVCGTLYFLGSETLLGFMNQESAEFFATLGSGSRFLSVERGVIDLRDLFYYVSLTGFFLALNTLAIERKRLELVPLDRPSQWKSARLSAGLFGLNLLVGNVLLHEIRPGRLDLTEDHLYTVSDVTVDVIQALDEKINITGYFSERTHPLLAPLVPQVKDLLKEYQARGGNKIEVNFVDPHSDEELEKELSSTYGIKSLPISVADRSEMSFVNAYFHLLIRYGDEHLVLGFEDLVDIRRDHSNNDFELQLKGLEYTLTKSIKAVSQEFQSLDALMSSQPIKITAYATPTAQLPEEIQALSKTLEELFKELQERAKANGGTLSYSFVDPSTLPAEKQQKLADDYGFTPIRLSLLDTSVYYMYGLIEVGSRSESMMFLQKDLSQENLSRLIEAAIRRSAPGFKKTIGLMTKSDTADHPAMPYGQAPPPPKSDYRSLEQLLNIDFNVQRLELKKDLIPSDIDILLIAKPGDLTMDQRFAIDQYLMSGGTVIALANHKTIEPEFVGNGNGQVPPTFHANDLSPQLLDLLATYGVQVGQGFVADTSNLDIVYPVSRGFNRIQITQAGYPFFNQITRADFPDHAHVGLSGLNSLTVLWPSPLRIEGLAEGVKAEPLLMSSARSWIHEEEDLSPSINPGLKERARHVLAYVLEGSFRSAFAPKLKDQPSSSNAQNPSATASEADVVKEEERSQLRDDMNQTGRVLNSAVTGAKLIVISSPELVSDLGLGLANYYTGLFGLRGDYDNSLMMFQNFVEWAVEDDNLASIRTGGASARVLRSLSQSEQRTYEWMNYLISLVLLVLITLSATLPRRFAAKVA